MLPTIVVTAVLLSPLPSGTAEPRSPLRVQVLLDRAHFYHGESDGVSGGNQRRALAAFARARVGSGRGQRAAAAHAESRGHVPTNWDAAELARLVSTGTPAVLQE